MEYGFYFIVDGKRMHDTIYIDRYKSTVHQAKALLLKKYPSATNITLSYRGYKKELM